jgi:hypothetical protein
MASWLIEETDIPLLPNTGYAALVAQRYAFNAWFQSRQDRAPSNRQSRARILIAYLTVAHSQGDSRRRRSREHRPCSGPEPEGCPVQRSALSRKIMPADCANIGPKIQVTNATRDIAPTAQGSGSSMGSLPAPALIIQVEMRRAPVCVGGSPPAR